MAISVILTWRYTVAHTKSNDIYLNKVDSVT